MNACNDVVNVRVSFSYHRAAATLLLKPTSNVIINSLNAQ